MNGSLYRSLVLLAMATSTACAPSPALPRENAATAPQSAPAVTRTLVMAIAPEPEALSLEIGSAFALVNPMRLFNASLALLDDREVPRPYLAESLPQLNSETWRVFSDGRMETTYRLRPGLTWHDGTPLSSEDFVLAWQVYRTPEFGVAGRPPQSEIDQVSAPDEHTVVITWRGLYAGAGALGSEKSALLPLPRQIFARYRDQGQLAASANDPRPDPPRSTSRDPGPARNVERVSVGAASVTRSPETGSSARGWEARKERRSLDSTTGCPMWGAIPHRGGEPRTAFPPRVRLTINL